MFFTVPVRTSPSWRTSSVCFFFSSRSSSRTERRESTTLPRRRLSLMTFARMLWPTIAARFLTGRRSTCEPGRNALTPTSTARPPLTTSTTRPSTGRPFSWAWVIASQTLILSALSLERTLSPSESSLASRYTSISSPTFVRLPCRWNSSIGIAPSLLWPTSTRTSLEPMWTTRPRTTSPSSNSVTPLSYQSSMRSSAPSPPSPFGPPRCCRGSSFFIPPVPPVILFARTAYDSDRSRPALAVAGTDTVPEPRNGVHHLAAGDLVLTPPIGPPLGLEPERFSERHRHLCRARQAAPPRPRPAGAAHVDRHDRGAARHRQQARARLGGPDVALVAARALGEHEQRAAPLEHALGRPEGAGIGSFPADRPRVETVDQRAEQGDLEELRLGQIGQLPIRRAANERRVEHARVVRDQQHRPVRGDVLAPGRLEPEQEAHRRHRQDPHNGVQTIPRSRRVAASLRMLDRRQQTLDDLIRGQVGGVQLDRAFRLAQRSQLARLILGVPRGELARDRGQ